jgi:hypothetical protein
MPLAPIPDMVAEAKLNAALEPLISMPSLATPLVVAMVTAPPLNVPPLTPVRLIASAATVPVDCSVAKVAPLPPMIMPFQFRIWPVAVCTELLPVTLTVPPPVALKPMPDVVVIARPPVKLNVAPVLLVRSTALLTLVVSVTAPPKAIVPPELLVATMPGPPSLRVIVLAASKVTEPPPMPWMLTTLPPGLVMSTLLRLTIALTSLLAGVPWSPSITKAWFVAPLAVSMATLLKV